VTFSSFVGIALTLAIVLGLLAITLRVVRRMAIGPASGRGTLRMEVLRRIPLGPRQGIAVVRIGTQTVAVSVGDGGVRQLLVLEPEDMSDEPVVSAVMPAPRDFRTLLREGIRSAGVSIGMCVVRMVRAITHLPGLSCASQCEKGPAKELSKRCPLEEDERLAPIDAVPRTARY